MISLFATMLMSAAAPTAAAVGQNEVPIVMTQVGGARRYSVTIMVNGAPIEAALDTGSVGLRILATAFPTGGEATTRQVSLGFNSGVTLAGPVVRSRVTYGHQPEATVNVQRVDQIGCRPGAVSCAASMGDPNAYRIMGDGASGQGFGAILGIGLRPEVLGHPLEQAGLRRWIVELPRTPSETGRLVLNPSDAEAARFRKIPLIAGRDELRGCLVSAAAKACGPTMIDTGAPGITLFGFGDGDVPERGAAATLTLGDGAESVSMPIEVGRRDQASTVRARPSRPDAKSSLSFGVAPYHRWSILYDTTDHTIGVAERR